MSTKNRPKANYKGKKVDFEGFARQKNIEIQKNRIIRPKDISRLDKHSFKILAWSFCVQGNAPHKVFVLEKMKLIRRQRRWIFHCMGQKRVK